MKHPAPNFSTTRHLPASSPRDSLPDPKSSGWGSKFVNSRRPFSLQWEGMNSFSTTTLTDLEKLIHELKGQISREAAQENVLTRIRIASLSDMERRLQDIRRLTSRQKIKLAFIGPVGVGKTTIICDLLVPVRRQSRLNFHPYPVALDAVHDHL